MDCSAPIAQVPLSPPGPVPALPAIFYILLPIYNKNLTTSPHQIPSISQPNPTGSWCKNYKVIREDVARTGMTEEVRDVYSIAYLSYWTVAFS